MWKIWLGIGIGGIVGAVIILLGVINQARFSVIFYRAVLSMVVFGGGSCILAFVYERYLLPYLLHKSVSKNGNNIAEAEKNDQGLATHDAEGSVNQNMNESGQEFSPFTTENFNRVSPPNN